MSGWNVFLGVAAVIAFVGDLEAIARRRRSRSILLLLGFGALTVVLMLTLRENARVEARNRALTDVQARAQTLVDDWRHGLTSFEAFNNSAGENEGIAVAAADLLEDSLLCRPGAYETARARVETARRLADKLGFSDDVFAHDADDVWEDAADAAFEQVLGVAHVSPACS